MNKRTSIINISGDFDESLIQLARHLGTEKVRRALFNAVYGYGRRPRSKKQLMAVAGLDGSKSQQAQNALDELSRHHLIVKIDNDGSVKDGSRCLYLKDETVRANRPKIVRFADKPSLANSTPTKRRPASSGTTSIRSVTKVELKRRKRLVVLFLTSNPPAGKPLRVDAEVRRVQEAVRGSKFRDNVTIEYRPAADLDTIMDGLNDHHPQVVHFSGHGDEEGLLADRGKVARPTAESLPYSQLAKALAATDYRPEIVVLNSCWSSAAKKSILPLVKFLISMNVPISDLAAAAFAPRFYAALASGQSVRSSFDQGSLAVAAVSLSEAATPELHYADFDPAQTRLT
jgi:hypothetical protein